MNFEDMKKIWDEQKQQHMFVLDEEKLNEMITSRKRGSKRLVGIVEWIFISVNGLMGAFVLITDQVKGTSNPFILSLGILMMACAVTVYWLRRMRLESEDRFELTLIGNLDHAISNASHQARLSYWMLLYIVPVALLMALGIWYANKPMSWIVGIILAYALAMVLGRWEYRAWHLKRKQRLIAMREKLTESV